jgi:hypothetical protein
MTGTITNRDIYSLIVFYLKVASLSALASFALYELLAVWSHINFGDLSFRKLLIALWSLPDAEFFTVISVLLVVGAFSFMVGQGARGHLFENKLMRVWIASVALFNLSLIAGLLAGDVLFSGGGSDWFHSVFHIVELALVTFYVSSMGLMKVPFYRDAGTREDEEGKSKNK